ncbi:MAG: thioesterase family protein [Alphaproteobacteria bacterium]|nr:thioesterase family protein [Alphaproteobacteria bacterium]MCB1551295.1 thioesterase family protein [Alphaproteobacteria bacterium]MCB9985415.1 thioesterase family protein [Micavibrio sp.]HPQ51143.1 thioesterase family protein [Alphaproteobacteria bacterium]HRK98192.1 thioesterase family protein [Alphaproteobacteria bacterium]
MNLLLRVLWVWLSSYFKPRIADILAPADLNLRVLPNDLDFNMHMNNGRYLTIMDLGRLDLILRSGLLKMMLKQKSVPILASCKLRYRLSLDPFQKYKLRTQILGWDKKWVYIEQRFLKNGKVAAIGLVKGCFFDQRSKTTIPTADLLHLIGYDGTSPELPAHIIDWQKAETTLKEVTKNA